MTPDWKKGDLIAMPAELMPADKAVAYGCHVFVAEHDPILDPSHWAPGWRYGYAPCDQFRRATKADLDRLIAIHVDEIDRDIRRLKQLTDWRKVFFAATSS